MNINRNNCEEYFLLYADKELSAEEKSLVEVFVQQNPDVANEFLVLQQLVVKPDNTIQFKDKNSLLRKEALSPSQYIDENNYEEKFLLYNDNELSISEKEEIENYVLTNPSLQNEFSLLQQIKYQADESIVFPDKRHLYKKEDRVKVIPLRWMALAAAILIGLGLWTGAAYLKKEKTKQHISKQTTPKENPGKLITKQADVKNVPLVVLDMDTNTSKFKSVTKARDNSEKKLLHAQQGLNVKSLIPTDKKAEVINTIIEDEKQDIAINDLPGKKDVSVTGKPPQLIITAEAKSKIDVKAFLPQDNYAQPASYISDADVKNENYVFYNITTEEFNKSRVGTFLKKVKRTIERKISLKNKFKMGSAEMTNDDEK